MISFLIPIAKETLLTEGCISKGALLIPKVENGCKSEVISCATIEFKQCILNALNQTFKGATLSMEFLVKQQKYFFLLPCLQQFWDAICRYQLR